MAIGLSEVEPAVVIGVEGREPEAEYEPGWRGQPGLRQSGR